METLHSHTEMIDLNPLIDERHPIKPPSHATPEEFYCTWYSITDRISYLPGLPSGKVTYNACFHDLENGIQTHIFAPAGLEIRGRWTLGGNLPGEPIAPVELGLGAPIQGLYLREDVDMRCNVLMTRFVKKTTQKAHAALIDRLVIKAHVTDTVLGERRISDVRLNTSRASQYSGSQVSGEYSPSVYEDTPVLEDAPRLLPFEGQDDDRRSYKSLYPEPLKSGRSSVASSNGSIASGNRQNSFGENDELSLSAHPNQRNARLPDSTTQAQNPLGRRSPSPRALASNEQARGRSPSPNPQRQQQDNSLSSRDQQRMGSRHNSVQNELHFEVQPVQNEYHVTVPRRESQQFAYPSPKMQNELHFEVSRASLQQYPYPNPLLVHNPNPNGALARPFRSEIAGGYGGRMEQNMMQYQPPPPQFGHVELHG